MKERLVTVFGGSGFLGRHLVRRLAARGDRIRIAVRRPHEAEFLRPAGIVGQIHFYQANVRYGESIKSAIEDADAVVNLVGILFNAGRQTFDTIHTEGAGKIAAAAAEAGVKRLIHVSAIGADPASRSEYARSKGLGEEKIREHFPGATILRPSIVFGPEDDFLNRFAAMAQLAPVLPLIGGGHTRFQPVYVGDVAAAIAACLDRDDATGQVFELGGPRTYSFRELLEYILAETGRNRAFVNLPFGLAKIQARFLELLPKPLLTVDQVRLLERDNVVSEGASSLADLDIEPTPLETIAPTYLWRYRRGGEFAD